MNNGSDDNEEVMAYEASYGDPGHNELATIVSPDKKNAVLYTWYDN